MLEYNDENLLMLDAQGLSHSEIAEQFGKSRNSINGRLYRIRQKNPELVQPRVMGRHPKGREEHAAKSMRMRNAKMQQKLRTAATDQGLAKIKAKFNRMAPKLFVNPHQEYSKADLREMLRQAVENTK